MTPRRSRRIAVDTAKHKDYLQAAHQFYIGADAAMSLENWSAAALLVVHAAIAYTDALTIKIGGVKSQGDDHMAAVDVARELIAVDDAGRKALTHLVRVIQEKNVVSYSGDVSSRNQAESLWKHLERYRSWALLLLNA